MTLTKELEQLKEQYCEKGILTIYLSTDQTSNDQQKGEWKIRLKNGLKRLEEYIQSSDEKNVKTYKTLKKKATEEILKLQTELPKSLVVLTFPSGELVVKRLQIKVENEFHWEKKPVIRQLENIQKEYPQEGIIFIQKEEVLVIKTSLTEVNSELGFDLEVDDEDWKQYEGVAASERMASSANHRDKYDQRIEALQQRWFKKLATILEKQAVEEGWQHIYLVGEPELVSEFKKHIAFPSRTVINKNYTKCSSKEIVNQVLVS